MSLDERILVETVGNEKYDLGQSILKDKRREGGEKELDKRNEVLPDREVLQRY